MQQIAVTLILIAIFYLLSSLILEKLARKLKVQRIILELILGILIGSTSLLSIVNFSYASFVAIASAVILLFSVGAGSKLQLLLKETRNILLLASTGVLIPFVFVYFVCTAFHIHDTTALFIAAAAVSTSVGISARILYENHKCNSDIGAIILGASVVDDIYGLVLLSILTAYYYKDKGNIISVLASAVIFVAVVALSFYAKRLIAKKIKKRDNVLVALSPAIVSLPFVAGFLSLTPITGAYFSGLLAAGELSQKGIKIQRYLYTLMVPLFFIYTGTRIGVQTLFNLNVVGLGICLFIAVLVGQLVAGLTLSPFIGLYHGLLTGFGMLPRGEVAMYIAVTALSMGVISRANFGSITIMILLCTISVSALLKRFIRSACKVEFS